MFAKKEKIGKDVWKFLTNRWSNFYFKRIDGQHKMALGYKSTYLFYRRDFIEALRSQLTISNDNDVMVGT